MLFDFKSFKDKTFALVHYFVMRMQNSYGLTTSTSTLDGIIYIIYKNVTCMN